MTWTNSWAIKWLVFKADPALNYLNIKIIKYKMKISNLKTIINNEIGMQAIECINDKKNVWYGESKPKTDQLFKDFTVKIQSHEWTCRLLLLSILHH